MANETEQAEPEGDGAEAVSAELAPGSEDQAGGDALADEWAALADDDEDDGPGLPPKKSSDTRKLELWP